MKEKKALRAHEEEKLPWDLMEEILSRVPPNSLVRFRIVSKPWNNLFNDKRFINNHKTAFHFVLATESKIYSVNVSNPNKIVVNELTLDITGLDESHQKPEKLIDFSEFLLCRFIQGSAVWNPWLRQSTWINPPGNLKIHGIGYNNNKSYKIIGSGWKIYAFASDAWKDHEGNSNKTTKCDILTDNRVSLNGTLYLVATSYKGNEDCLFMWGFDFSEDIFFRICELPCGKNHPRDAVVLAVFKGDRFSLLKQCYATKKIEILVTKDKITSSINCDDDEAVVWINFMQVSIPNFPDLVHESHTGYSQPSYFIDIDNKRLNICSCDETGRAWIYVVWENKLISKTRIDSVVDHWPLHSTYNPNLVMVPSIQREEVEEVKSQV